MIAFVVAYTKNRVIGKDGTMPWHLPGDLKRFKEVTMHHTVIMGRKTYESIGHPLVNRENIILSKTKKYEGDTIQTMTSLEEALLYAKDKDVYIIGGAKVFKEALEYVDIMYVTEIDAVMEGDTFFPDFDEALFERIEESIHEEQYTYRFVTYKRKEKNYETNC